MVKRSCMLFLFFMLFSNEISSKKLIKQPKGQRTFNSVMESLAPELRPVWQSRMEKLGLSYPPKSIKIYSIKKDRLLEVWAEGPQRKFHKIRTYGIRGASGKSGPKLKEGDRQVPEGIYPVTWLNPNSKFHLSIKIGYPNYEDKMHSREYGFRNPGGQIFIHGSFFSRGCIAIGNYAIEELFLLVADVGKQNTQVVIAPVDLRYDDLPRRIKYDSQWVRDRYQQIYDAVEGLE